MPVGRRANREKNDSGLRRRLEVGSRACGCTVGGEPVAGNSDRYAIRTRNLQDWNLTRCRCANRSKAIAHEDAAAVPLEHDLGHAACVAASRSPSGAATPPGGVDRDSCSSRAIDSASWAATWPPIARQLFGSEHALGAHRHGVKHCGQAGTAYAPRGSPSGSHTDGPRVSPKVSVHLNMKYKLSLVFLKRRGPYGRSVA